MIGMSPSSRGLGHRPFTAVTGVRIPLGMDYFCTFCASVLYHCRLINDSIMYIHHIYDIDLCDHSGKILRMKNYEGHIIMVVNIASECGFNEQLEEMELCFQLFKDYRFTILAFPSDQFNQEPLDDDEIVMHNEARFPVTYPLFPKVMVNGKQAHPLFRYLTNALPGFLGTQSVKWNFTKFIIDRTGKPVRRFSPITNMEIVSEYIANLIEQQPR